MTIGGRMATQPQAPKREPLPPAKPAYVVIGPTMLPPTFPPTIKLPPDGASVPNGGHVASQASTPNAKPLPPSKPDYIITGPTPLPPKFPRTVKPGSSSSVASSRDEAPSHDRRHNGDG